MQRAFWLIVTLAAVFAGCQAAWKPRAPADGPGAGADYLSKGAVAKDVTPERAPAVESALIWSEKYAHAVEDLSQEQQRNRKLMDEGRTLQQQLDAAKAELATANRELEEANALLIEVRQENNRWKADVLGYRDEMRRSHLTELEALGKVLRLLGGELSPAEAAAAPAAGTSPATAEQTAAQPMKSNAPAAVADTTPPPTGKEPARATTP